MTLTVSDRAVVPGFDPPSVIALVAIDEQPDVRLVTNIVGCPWDAVHIGMAVRVVFEQHGDTWLPLFEPVSA